VALEQDDVVSRPERGERGGDLSVPGVANGATAISPSVTAASGTRSFGGGTPATVSATAVMGCACTTAATSLRAA
jgi:hypothetical protein